MKYLKYILVIISNVVISTILACGPMVYELPHPTHLRLTDKINDIDTKTENLLLWQSQTSRDVKLQDIYDVIYGDVTPKFHGPYNTHKSPGSYNTRQNPSLYWVIDNKESLGDNTFLNYLSNTSDDEAMQFIMLAKHIAGLREDRNSPWYYPANRVEMETGFDCVIETIKGYKGKRFYNRYSLQLIRALFASARYEECITTFNERFGNIPDSDLMKRLSQDYVAGAALRIGVSQTALNYFASRGDVTSIARFSKVKDPFRLAALTNPDSPNLLYYIERAFHGNGYLPLSHTDSLMVKNSILPTVRQVVKRKNVKNRAMWYYVLAVGEGEFNNNYSAAYRYIQKAMKYKGGRFSDHIRGYKIVTESVLGKQVNLVSNLKWLESKITDKTSIDKNYWEQVMQYLVFTHIAPWYVSRGDTITAMQLANYGDNMPLKYNTSCWRYSTAYGDWQTEEIIPARTDPKPWNDHDYSNTFFRFMLMQNPHTIERYIKSLSSSRKLASYLNSRSFTSRDYLYDVVGTLYLAKRDYKNAIRTLSKVSDKYQKLLNVEPCGILKRNPFYTFGTTKEDNITNHKKLYFAREMYRLECVMRTSTDPNKRGLARLKYAIGLKNSFDRCWALTGYSNGYCYVAATNELTAPNTEDAEEWLHDIEDKEIRALIKATEDADKMIKIALAEIKDPEALAKANYMTGNFLTIARRYPDTKIGRMMASKCDSWSNWIKKSSKTKTIKKRNKSA